MCLLYLGLHYLSQDKLTDSIITMGKALNHAEELFTPENPHVCYHKPYKPTQ